MCRRCVIFSLAELFVEFFRELYSPGRSPTRISNWNSISWRIDGNIPYERIRGDGWFKGLKQPHDFLEPTFAFVSARLIWNVQIFYVEANFFRLGFVVEDFCLRESCAFVWYRAVDLDGVFFVICETNVAILKLRTFKPVKRFEQKHSFRYLATRTTRKLDKFSLEGVFFRKVETFII